MSEALQYFSSEDGEHELPWVQSAISARRRAAPDGLVLFDRLLQLAQIDPVLYPPEDHLSLRRLLSAIDDSATFDTLKKNCLVYYLLKEFADGRETEYAHKRRIPKRFVTSTDAYWLLDHEQYEPGCKKLCAPAVVPDFMSSILRMLATASNQTEASKLIVNIFTYQAPDLTDMEDAKIILAACLRTGRVVEALELGRKVAAGNLNEDEEVTEEAVQQTAQATSNIINFILDTCFCISPPLSSTLDKLLYIPLSTVEDAAMMKWLSTALDSNSSLPADNLPLLTEWVTGRLMAQGRYVDAITLLSASSTSLRRSAQAQKRVQDVLADLYPVLPPIQRSLVDVTLARSNQPEERKQPVASTSTAAASISQMPWQGSLTVPHLPAPRSLLQAKANKAILDELKAGGKPLNREQDLPLSAGGLLRPSTQNNIGVSRSQGRHDERMDVWSAVKRSDSPAKPRHRAYGSPMPASPMQTGTPGRSIASPFSAAPATGAQSSRKPSVQGFGLSRPSGAGDHRPATQLDFSEAMRKYQNRQSRSQPQQEECQPPREAPKAFDMPPKAPRRHLPPGAFPSSASTSGATNLTDDEGTQHSDGDISDISEVPGSVRRQKLPENVNVTDFAAPPARSTRSRRQSSVPPMQQQQQQQTSAPTTGRKTRQRTTSTKDMVDPTPSKKGRTTSSNTATKDNTAPRRSKRLGSVAPSEPDLQMMEMPGADDSVMVENSMIGKGSSRTRTGHTPRRRRP